MSDKEPCPPSEYPLRDLDHMKHLVELTKEESITIPSGLTRDERRKWARDRMKELNRE